MIAVLSGWPQLWALVMLVVVLAFLPYIIRSAVTSTIDILFSAVQHVVARLQTFSADHVDDAAAVEATPQGAQQAVAVPTCVNVECTVVQLPGGDVVDLRAETAPARPAAAGASPVLVTGGFALAIAALIAGLMYWRRMRLDAWHEDRLDQAAANTAVHGTFPEPEGAA